MLFPEYLETWRKTDFGCYSYFCTYYEWLWANNLTSLSLISCNNSRTHLIELSQLKSELLINCLSHNSVNGDFSHRWPHHFKV